MIPSYKEQNNLNMKNRVTVTRAPRLNLVSPASCYGTKLLVNTEDMAIWVHSNDGMLCLDSDSGELLKNVQWHSKFVVLENAEAMCKWVAGGRRLEDLPSDDGQCLFSDLEFGELFLIFNGCGAIGMKTDDCKFVEVGTCGGATEHPCNSTTIVTRLNIGDTIEITE